MGKISPVSIKYNIIAEIKLTSIADKSDVIGAVFGQTEGLLGADLELRELQKAGKIGRITVDLRSGNGKSQGEIVIPSSMGKSETAIIAASLETIDRVGPCNARIKVKKIEDVRISKRQFILDRAKELLRELVISQPDSQEFTNQVTQTVRSLEISEYGEDKLPAGPLVAASDEVIVVEGRADVVNLLKYGIRNVVGLDGTKSINTIAKLSKEKELTLFVDGDRGGDLIIRKLLGSADIDYTCKAPDGKEVEELTMKEIQKALRAREPVNPSAETETDEAAKDERVEQLIFQESPSHEAFDEKKPDKMAEDEDEPELEIKAETEPRPRESREERPERIERQERSESRSERPERRERYDRRERPDRFGRRDRVFRGNREGREGREDRYSRPTTSSGTDVIKKNAEVLKQMTTEITGTRGAFLLDDSLNILGKVPVKELNDTLRNMGEDIYFIIMDGTTDSDLIRNAEQKKVRYIISTDSTPKAGRVNVVPSSQLSQ